MATGTRPVLSEGTLQAIQAYGEQMHLRLTKGDIAQIENCVSLWTKAEDCGMEFCRICVIIWEAIKSIFCQSIWQQTRKMLVERANPPTGTPTEEGAKLAAEFALTRFVELNERKARRDDADGMRDFRRAIEQQRVISAQRHTEAADQRLLSAAQSGRPAAAAGAGAPPRGAAAEGPRGLRPGAAGVSTPSLRPPHASGATAPQRAAGAPPSRFAASTASGATAALASEAALRQELVRVADERLALTPDNALPPGTTKAQIRELTMQTLRLTPADALAQVVEQSRQDLARFKALTPEQRAAALAPSIDIEQQRVISAQRHAEAAGQRLISAAQSGRPADIGSAMGELFISMTASASGAGAPRSAASSAVARPQASGDEASLRAEMMGMVDEELALTPDSAVPRGVTKAQIRTFQMQTLTLVPLNVLTQTVERSRRDLPRFRQLTPEQRGAEFAARWGAPGPGGSSSAECLQMAISAMSVLASASEAGGDGSAAFQALMVAGGAGSVVGAPGVASSR
jgi:hypothetical protein